MWNVILLVAVGWCLLSVPVSLCLGKMLARQTTTAPDTTPLRATTAGRRVSNAA